MAVYLGETKVNPKMASSIVKVNNIEIERLNVTENGIYTAPQGKAYSPIDVNISNTAASIYKFYDEHGNELTDHSVMGLETAAYYDKGGDTGLPVGGRIFFIDGSNVEGDGDKFYVYNPEIIMSTFFLPWSTSASSFSLGFSERVGIGDGKQIMEDYANNSFLGDGGCFDFAYNLTLGDCNDWYVPNCSEMGTLWRAVQQGLINDSISYQLMYLGHLWTANEFYDGTGSNALYWEGDLRSWCYMDKSESNYCSAIAIRSF